MPDEPLDQREAPFLDAMAAMLRQERTPFNLPGHKQGRGADSSVTAVLGEQVFRCDVALPGMLDDRLASHGTDVRAERLAAQALGADTVFLSTNGTSMSLQVAILSVAAPGDEIVMARNMHKSAINALILGGAHPVLVQPEFDRELALAHSVTPQAVEAALDAHPDARAVVVVCPTYYGVVADIPALASICHARGIPLIADEAWGAHFVFHQDYPDSALAAGADLAVSSLHKAGSGLMQGSIVAAKGERLDTTRLHQTLALLESTSTSMLILAALDGARRQFATRGEEVLGRMLRLARRAREEIAAIPGLAVMGREVLRHPGAIELDETKIVIDVRALGITDFAAADWLIEEQRMPMELGDHRRLMAMITVGDDDTTVDRLVAALRQLPGAAPQLRARGTMTVADPAALTTELVMPPREAFFAPRRRVPLDDAEGRISAESVIPYPPGIPQITPGERWTREIAEYLRQGLAHGMHIVDCADSKLEQVLVVDSD